MENVNIPACLACHNQTDPLPAAVYNDVLSKLKRGTAPSKATQARTEPRECTDVIRSSGAAGCSNLIHALLPKFIV
jgi:hypothetical protein